MAISPTLKITSIAVGAGGIVTGGAVGIHNYLSKSNEEGKKESKTTTDSSQTAETKTIMSLIDAGYRLLSKEKDQNDKWKEGWDKFKQKYESGDPQNIHVSWRFENWNTSKASSDAPDEFKTKCTENSKGNVTGKTDPLFVVIKDYCLTKEASVQS